VTELEQAKAKAAFAYNAAADYFDNPVSSFWHRFGRRTVDGLDLKPGERVLDVCCGSGGSALPAAERVGPSGQVVAADLAERLVVLGRDKARAAALENLEFRVADMLKLGYPDGHFDAVVCVFGIFFVPDMEAAVAELWRMVRPGGRLAITTWGPNLFEPANGAFWDAIGQLRPDLYRSFNPWDRISHPDGLYSMLANVGIRNCDIVAETGEHPIDAPEDWWAIAMGSGYRGTLAQLDQDTLLRVRDHNLSRLYADQVASIETNVIYAVAGKPDHR
jgi:SAM-dependent methyltransferase